MADTIDVIHERMLSNISDEYDKTEGSFFYDATKPVAIELEKAYKDQEEILDKGFVETATGEWLDKKVAEQGLTRKPATKATGYVTIEGSEGAIINAGDKVANDTVTYTILESKTIDSTLKASVQVECDEFGSVGNVPINAIKYFPVTLSGLTKVYNEEKIDNGYDGETDEELRQRYYDKVRTPATSGNKYHYRNWAKEVPGVGDAKVFPLWNGPGTVKVVIIDSNKTGADSQLVTDVYNHIEENRPIGATVTVESATELQINIDVTLTIDSNNYTIEQVKRNIENAITEHLKEIAFKENYVSYAKIGSLILNSNGVLDYSNLLINNNNSNVSIKETEVAVLGVVTVV
ncbi:baseplate J/gp47 family protein (plasmid) [Crassaminicella thermophila]|uniref:Baseplate J/gp47 family protein n=1 Tax=Crassaminicella thermophila TaxID=2599308 RepID=A0A5C0SH13_CRATE|nr:baseplate J/gp47 family protein [Crassaminicella thermophila]QEK13733.1 baseplate J/gp47 family protein [Crassaminicella thermophila]